MITRAGVGAKLRAIRRASDWTLAQVGAASGIPVSTLSRIENDQVSPTYDQLSRLSEGLGLDIAQLFTAGETLPVRAHAARRSINRLGEGELIDATNQALRYLSTDLLNKPFTPILAELKTRRVEDLGEFTHHPGEEFVFVLEGVLELHSECYAPLRLVAGESIFFDSSVPHAYLAAGKGTCRVLSICTVPHHHLTGEKTSARKAAPKKAGGTRKRAAA